MHANPVIQGQGDVRQVSFGDDSKIFVEFFTEAEYQEYASKNAGRPVYKDEDYVRIIVPGQRDTRIRKVKTLSDITGPSDPERFPRQWEKYKLQQEQGHEGLALTEWPFLTKSEALNFKARNIHTVEHLAALSDLQVQSIGPGGLQLRQKAKDTLEGNADTTNLIARLDRLEADNKALKQQLAMAAQQPAPQPVAMAPMAIHQPQTQYVPEPLISSRLQENLDVSAKRPGRLKKIETTN